MMEVHVIYSGSVQGVGFRANTQMLARKLRLNGMVKNLANGKVEIIAQGSKKDLKLLISQVKTLFPGASIESISYIDHPKIMDSGFTIGI